MNITILRETQGYRATQSARGVRITAKAVRVYPKSRVVSLRVWKQLAGMSDQSFDGSVVLELGIGAFNRR